MLSAADYAEALRTIPPDVGRDEWIQAGMAARAAGLTEDDFLQWSEPAASFNERDAKAVWRSFTGNGVTAGTLVHIARRYGWMPPKTMFTPQELINAALPATDAHPYIRKKRGTAEGLLVLPHDHPLRIKGVDCGGALLVPAREADGTLRTVQVIGSEKLNLAGHKFEDGYFLVGEPTPHAPIYVCEGLGTAWACWRATGRASAVAFGIGRFRRVAKALSAAYPESTLALVPDRGAEAEAGKVARDLKVRMVTLPLDMPLKSDAWDLAEQQGDDALDQLLSDPHGPNDEVRDANLHVSAESISDQAAQICAPSGPREVDLALLASTPPLQPQFLVPDLIPEGEITLLGGHGGTGKSWIALMLAVCIATGKDFFGIPVEQRKAAYISFEDCANVLHWRLSRVAFALGISIHDLVERMRLFDGTTSPESWFARGEYGECSLTPQFEQMRQRLDGAQFIVVDGSSDTFAANENDRAQVKAFLRGLRTMVPPDGGLLLLAHVDKSSAAVGAASLGFSGSTGWSNGVRARLFLFQETEGEDGTPTGNVRLEVRKSNLGAVGAGLTLRFDEGYKIFKRIDAAPVAGEKVDELEGILRVIQHAYEAGNPIPAAMHGPRTAYAVASSFDDLPSSLKTRMGKKRFNAYIERLRSSGRIQTEARTRPNRHVSEVFRVAF